MEIEVGEFVRTKKYGDIGKLLKITNTKVYLDSIGYPIDRNEIAKHSKEPIDLVEVGDYVNGKEVIEVREQEGKIYLMTGYVPQSYIKEDIKSIVTHEQFESIEYKVEEGK